MPRRLPHILCFAPYTDWSIHSARQVTILQGLRQRGCSVTYVTCDGAFSDCDLLQASTGAPAQKPANACLFCQARVSTRLAGWGMPFRWLGQWLTTEDRKAAGRWVQSLKTQDYITATHDDWAVGSWVKSSVHRHFRHNVLNMDDLSTAAVFGSYLYSGLLACFGLSRIFDEEKPDAQLLFNGRMAPTRIALELAKARGVRTICEERAHVPGRLQLYDNANCQDISGAAALWSDWKNVPLAADEIAEVGAVLAERWHGRSIDVTMFSSGVGAGGDVWKTLNLDRAKPLYVLFSSSIDEAAGLDISRDTFPTQFAWIDATINYAASHPDIQLVIRVHPNAGSKKSLGTNPQDSAYFESLNGRLPPNVRLVPGDDPISSYDLAVAATVGLIWFSQMGLEMAALGRPVIRVAGSTFVEHADFIQAPRSPAKYTAALDQFSAGRNGIDWAATIQAWRCAHVYFLRRAFPFPLVKQPNWFVGEPAYETMDALQPGRDATLDHICDVFMTGKALYAPAETRPPALAAQERELIAARIAPYNT
ncbi:MAG: hypothetical protein JNK21_00980 [Rhodospirillaceae bacterium]|nr:hypothetical protein [Rhodospirillaceae bacterium]